MAWVQRTLGPGFEEPARLVGVLGTSWGVLLAGALCLWLFGRRSLYGLLVLAAAEGLARKLLSSGFAVPRPDDPSILKYERVTGSASFPSGHVSTAAAAWVWMARATPFPLTGALLVVAAVALGRVFLGVHWVTDVVGGAALGGGLAWIWPRVMARLSALTADWSAGTWATLAGLVLAAAAAAVAFLAGESPYLWRWSGFAAGAALALPVEWSRVGYRPHPAPGKRARTALLGGAGLAPLLGAHLAGAPSPPLDAVLLLAGALWAFLAVPAVASNRGWSGPASAREGGGEPAGRHRTADRTSHATPEG